MVITKLVANGNFYTFSSQVVNLDPGVPYGNIIILEDLQYITFKTIKFLELALTERISLYS